MVVPTGTATPWRELTTYPYPLEDEHVVFIRDGHVTGSADLLAEALRADGVVRSLGRAIPIAETATLDIGYYGHVDESDEDELCDANGETAYGDEVAQVVPCVVAIVDIREE